VLGVVGEGVPRILHTKNILAYACHTPLTTTTTTTTTPSTTVAHRMWSVKASVIHNRGNRQQATGNRQ